MSLSMHVHFLIITYIHISCIFSELVYQRASVRTTQYTHTHTHYSYKSLIVNVLDLNCHCLNRYCLRPGLLLFELLLFELLLS